MHVKCDKKCIAIVGAGFLSGWVEVLFGSPIDVVKTRMQLRETGSIYEIRKIMKQQVRCRLLNKLLFWRGFYDGASSRFIGVGFMRLLFWGGMDGTRNLLKGSNLNPYIECILIGTGGAISQIVVDGWVEFVKTQTIYEKMVTGRNEKLSGTQMMKQFSRGMVTTFSRNIGFAITLQVSMHGMVGFFNNDNMYVNRLIIPAIAGLIGSVTTQGLDNMKTAVQGREMSIRDAYIHVRKTGFFRGVVPRGILSCVNIGVSYFSYRYFFDLLTNVL